jgi:hypothetical protein
MLNTNVQLKRTCTIRTPALNPVVCTSINSHMCGQYTKLLPCRQEQSRSARKLSSTWTIIDRVKLEQHRSTSNVDHSSKQWTHNDNNESKVLSPHQLCSQLNVKLEYLIRQRIIERNRIVGRVHQSRAMPVKSQAILTQATRDVSNRTRLSSMSQSTATTIRSSSTSIIALKPTNKTLTTSSSIASNHTTIINDDFLDRHSIEDKEEIFEEMVEEENVNFLQQTS